MCGIVVPFELIDLFKKSSRGWHCSVAIKIPSIMPTFHIDSGSCPSCSVASPAPAPSLRKAAEDGSSDWAPATTWETQTKLLALARPGTGCCSLLGREPANTELYLVLPLGNSLSSKMNFFLNTKVP